MGATQMTHEVGCLPMQWIASQPLSSVPQEMGLIGLHQMAFFCSDFHLGLANRKYQ